MRLGKKMLTFLIALLVLTSGYAAALTLPEVKEKASSPQGGDVVLQWIPGNVWNDPYTDGNGVTWHISTWAGQVVTRSDGTTLWMEPNFWNVAGGDGENFMRFISDEDSVAFYVNMSSVQTNYGGNAYATPNVVFVGRGPQEWWGGKPVMGNYGWFSLPMNGADIGSLNSVWTRVNFEFVKDEDTLVRTGLMMWFESTDYQGWFGGWRLGEVYIAFSDDYGGIVNTQYPPADIGTLETTVYVNGAPKEVTFTLQRTWNWDHFVLEFVPNETIAPNGGDVLIDVKPFAQAAIQGIVDDPYSGWTPDQIVWTSIGFSTYSGSNGGSFEYGWLLKDARVFPSLSDAQMSIIGEKAKEAVSGDTVLQWAPGWFWAPAYDDNGVTRQICTWPGQLVTRSDNTTLWIEPNFWNIVGGDGENYMRFASSSDEVIFYVNLNNVQTQWGGNAWATPAVVFAGRVPPSVSGGNELPKAGGYGWFELPMPASNLSSYENITTKVSFELAKDGGTLARAGFIMWFEDTTGHQLAEAYLPFFDDYGGIVGAQYPPVVVGEVNLTVYVNGQPKNLTFTIQKAWNWNNFAFEFIPNETIATSGEVTVDIKPVAERVVQEIIADQYSSYTESDIVWSSLAFGTYTGSNDNSLELGWVVHDARVVAPAAPQEEEEKEETTDQSQSRGYIEKLSRMSFFYHYHYNKEKELYEELEDMPADESIKAIAEEKKTLAEEEYEIASSFSPGLIYSGFGDPRVFTHLRRAYMLMREARKILENAVGYSNMIEKYGTLIELARGGNVDPDIINEAEDLKSASEEEYQKALSALDDPEELLAHLQEANELLKKALNAIEGAATSTEFAKKILEIHELASSKTAGDIQFTWWDQWLEKAIERSDGTTVWMQSNFWNVVGGEGEVFMRYVKATDEFAFYVNLKNVQTQWGGIAWATPEVIFAGRAPKQWWGDKPPVGGYDFINLPLKPSEIENYDHIWVKADYEMVRRSDSLVRFGLLLWFENSEGWPAVEVYVPFSDDYKGLVGVEERTNVGEITTTMIVNGEVIPDVKLAVQKGWNPGNWWSYEFIPEIQVTSGEVYIDIKPVVEKIIKEFLGSDVTWTSISLGSYSGSEGKSFEFGWIIHDVRFVTEGEAGTSG